ncbi:acylneuraminate cytidylyltransferase family protein [Sphingomonas sp. R647]|uniref:acylneuraminate cytidylyltransferase family protein n=1 Tax=Sphingomonas sp. R647 TaxID=2875233 RepID=UPI001CD71328|nr:acylneuraminate cytidylyltransferase family protein [Sphingomonas sp. R647]MCA1200123.1 acylneuraminate cytidylyltransferase family protein [Sphingomonas sp. R647]
MRQSVRIKPNTAYGLVLGRGGSKGLPGKNVRKLGGHPLVCWSVAAGKVASLDRVICSTDDVDIASAALSAGAEVPFTRPASLAADGSTDYDVFNHFLNWLAENEKSIPEFVVQLRPTTPFRDPAWIESGLQLMRDGRIDSVRSVTPAPLPPYKMWRERDDGFLEPIIQVPGLAEAYNRPRGELPTALWHTGQLDIVRSEVVLAGSMTGARIKALNVPQDMAIDIDHMIDFQLAEICFDQIMPSSLIRYLQELSND